MRIYSNNRKYISYHISPIFCDDKSRSGDTAGREIVSNIQNTRLSTILLESISAEAGFAAGAESTAGVLARGGVGLEV